MSYSSILLFIKLYRLNAYYKVEIRGKCSLKKNGKEKLQGFEMWLRRRIERLNWVKTLRNEGVLKRMKTERSLLQIISVKKGELVKAYF